MLQVFGKARLVDGGGGGKTHGRRGQGPEIGHAPGVGIGREAAARAELPAESAKPLLFKAALEKGAGINPRRRVSLKQELIAAVVGAAPAEEVVKAHLHERRRGQVGGNVPPDAFPRIEGLQHHGRRIPAQQVLQSPFQGCLPGIAGLEVGGNGIEIGRVKRRFGHDQSGLGRKLLETP